MLQYGLLRCHGHDSWDQPIYGNHDKELVIVSRQREVQDYDGNRRARYTAELDLSDIGKGTYPYYMLKEIDEQPTVMRKLIQAYTDEQVK